MATSTYITTNVNSRSDFYNPSCEADDALHAKTERVVLANPNTSNDRVVYRAKADTKVRAGETEAEALVPSWRDLPVYHLHRYFDGLKALTYLGREKDFVYALNEFAAHTRLHIEPLWEFAAYLRNLDSAKLRRDWRHRLKRCDFSAEQRTFLLHILQASNTRHRKKYRFLGPELIRSWIEKRIAFWNATPAAKEKRQQRQNLFSHLPAVARALIDHIAKTKKLPVHENHPQRKRVLEKIGYKRQRELAKLQKEYVQEQKKLGMTGRIIGIKTKRLRRLSAQISAIRDQQADLNFDANKVVKLGHVSTTWVDWICGALLAPASNHRIDWDIERKIAQKLKSIAFDERESARWLFFISKWLRQRGGRKVNRSDFRDDGRYLFDCYAPGYLEKRQHPIWRLLENRAIRLARRYAPELLDYLEPISKPELEALQRCEPAGKQLVDVNMIAVQHCMTGTVTMFEHMRDSYGLDWSKVHLCGKAYSSHERSAEALRQGGMHVDTSYCEGIGYELQRDVQLYALVRNGIEEHKNNGQPIVALDDGGRLAKIVHADFPEYLSVFAFVEQTTRGLTELKNIPNLQRPAIDVASARSKQLEGPGIMQSIQEALYERMLPLHAEPFLLDRPALVVGYGPVGQEAARLLKQMGREVIVVDIDELARAKAEQDGFAVSEEITKELLERSAIVAGCTGKHSLPYRLLRNLKDGQVVFSCSSAQVETGMDVGCRVHEDVWVEDGETNFVLLMGGFPISFDGSGRSQDSPWLQFTRASLTEGVLQAVESLGKWNVVGQACIVSLADARVARISEHADEDKRAMLKKFHKDKARHRWFAKSRLKR